MSLLNNPGCIVFEIPGSQGNSDLNNLDERSQPCTALFVQIWQMPTSTHPTGRPRVWLTQRNRISSSVISNLLPLALFYWKRAVCFVDLHLLHLFKNWDDNGYLAYMLAMRSYFKALHEFKMFNKIAKSSRCHTTCLLWRIHQNPHPSQDDFSSLNLLSLLLKGI